MRRVWVLLIATAWILLSVPLLASAETREDPPGACTETIPAVRALQATHDQEWDLALAYAYWAIENNPLTPWATDLAESVLQESGWPEAVVETNRRNLHQARMQVLATGFLPNIGSGLLVLGLLLVVLLRKRLSTRLVQNLVILQALILVLSFASVLLVQKETLVQSPLEQGLRMMPVDQADIAGTLPAHTLARIEDRHDNYLLLTDGKTTGWAHRNAVLTRSELQEICQ